MPTTNGAYNKDQLEVVIMEVGDRMQADYPYINPLYTSLMLKSPHPEVRLAYMLTKVIIPYNHASDSGRISSRSVLQTTSLRPQRI